MATITLIPSTYYLSNSSYLSVSNASNMYTDTDSTTYATVTNSRTSTSSYYIYVRGFNFDDVPSGAIVSSFTIKLKGNYSGGYSQNMYLYDGTSTQMGSASSLSSSVATQTFTCNYDWDDVVAAGSDFGIRINCRRSSKNTTSYIYIYGAEIEVTYTMPVSATVTSTLSGSGTISPSGAYSTYEGNEYTLTITPTNTSDTVTATKDGVDITSELVGHGAGDTVSATPESVTTTSIQSGSSYAEYAIGHTAENPYSSSSNMYASSGSTGYAEYTFDFSDIPSGATIEDVSVTVAGHRESSTVDSSHVSQVQLYSGSTAKGTEQDFTSTSAQTITIEDVGTWTQAELQSAKLRHTVGYYGGLVTGVTWTVTYSTGSEITHYTYTYTVTGDATIDVTIGTPAPKDITVVITGNNSSVNYDKQSHTVTGYVATTTDTSYDTDANITFSGTASASQTNVGTAYMGLTASQFTNTNARYNVTFSVVDGYQRVVASSVTVTVTGNNNSTNYDGSSHSVSGYTISSSPNIYSSSDYTFSGSASASRTDAGTAYMGLASSQFTNTNSNFSTVTFNIVDGYQTINKITATVTITGHHNSSSYDGNSHSVSGYDVSTSTTLYSSSDFSFSGTASASRTNAGTTNIGLASSQFTNNNSNFSTVTFNVTDGYQTITPIGATITIVGANNSTTFDGSSHTVTGYTASSSTTLYDVDNDFTFSGTATASRTDAGTTNMGLASSQFANTNSNFTGVVFNVTDGYQTITPYSNTVIVTLHGNNEKVEYDGVSHTVSGYTVDNISVTLYQSSYFDLASGVSATATRTEGGRTYMGLTSESFVNNSGNFSSVTFRVTDGYIEIQVPGNGIIYFKDDTSWVASGKVYVKTDGSWVAQSDVSNVFDSEKKYRQG